jgi:beta-phosphoglucomutase-like phosphatase (HAD superfamily)
VSAPKPDPEPYLMAAGLLGVPIRECVAIEDSPTGVASAHAAGAAVLAVPSEVPIDPADGVRLLDSLTGADLALLAGLSAPVATR